MTKKEKKIKVSNEETKEKYIKIWTFYNFLNKTQWEIAKEFDISKRTVYKALRWVDQDLIKVPPKVLLNGAIFTVKERMKRNTDLFDKEYEKEEPSVRNIAELTREIRNDQQLLLKLQDLYQEEYKISGKISAPEILKLITQEKKD